MWTEGVQGFDPSQYILKYSEAFFAFDITGDLKIIKNLP